MVKILTILLPLFLVGCFLVPDIKLKRDVLPQEVIGVWTLTEDSWKDIKTDSEAQNFTGSHKDYTIEIRKDGTLHYKSIAELPAIAVDCQGNWVLKPNQNQEGNRLFITIQTENGPWSFDLYFTDEFSKEGTLLLWQYFGDPDVVQIRNV